MSSYYEKVGNGEPVCVDHELPFELPDGWCWSRIGTSFFINPRNDVSNESAEVSFVPMASIEPSHSGIIHPELRPWEQVKQGFTHFADGDIVFSKISPCFENGKYFIASGLTNGIGAGTTELFVLRPINDSIEPQYVFNYLSCSEFVRGATKTFMGTVGQQRVKREYVECSFLPVPPKKEQTRICAALSVGMKLLRLE